GWTSSDGLTMNCGFALWGARFAPGRAVSERIHFYLWRVHPSSARRGIVHIQHFFTATVIRYRNSATVRRGSPRMSGTRLMEPARRPRVSVNSGLPLLKMIFAGACGGPVVRTDGSTKYMSFGWARFSESV